MLPRDVRDLSHTFQCLYLSREGFSQHAASCFFFLFSSTSSAFIQEFTPERRPARPSLPFSSKRAPGWLTQRRHITPTHKFRVTITMCFIGHVNCTALCRIALSVLQSSKKKTKPEQLSWANAGKHKHWSVLCIHRGRSRCVSSYEKQTAPYTHTKLL